MAAPNAEGYAEAHADPRYMPCPHCGLATPRDGQFCAQCGWHLITGTPHPAEPMLSPRPASSSSGRRPTAKAAQRQALIDSFRTGPGGPRLADQLKDNDRLLAQLERDQDDAEMALRELLASRFKSAEGASLTDAVMDARRISEQRAGTGGVEQDLEMLVLVYREWESASTALSRARANQSALLDRWHQQGITRG